MIKKILIKIKGYNGECHAQLQKNAAGEQYLFQHTGRTCVFLQLSEQVYVWWQMRGK